MDKTINMRVCGIDQGSAIITVCPTLREVKCLDQILMSSARRGGIAAQLKLPDDNLQADIVQVDSIMQIAFWAPIQNPVNCLFYGPSYTYNTVRIFKTSNLPAMSTLSCHYKHTLRHNHMHDTKLQ